MNAEVHTMTMPVPRREITPMLLLDDALQRGAPFEIIRELMNLRDRESEFQALRAFNAAFAKAKAEMPVLLKNKQVGFAGRQGVTRTSYSHVDLAEIVREIAPRLAKHDLWHRFETVNDENKPIVVTCVIGHADGHMIRNTLRAGKDESGSKNAIQAIGSTVTYLSRYTLMAALGLAASEDDDGRGSESGPPISHDETVELQRRIDVAGIKLSRFCERFEIETLPELPASKLTEAFSAISAYELEKKKEAPRGERDE